MSFDMIWFPLVVSVLAAYSFNGFLQMLLRIVYILVSGGGGGVASEAGDCSYPTPTPHNIMGWCLLRWPTVASAHARWVGLIFECVSLVRKLGMLEDYSVSPRLYGPYHTHGVFKLENVRCQTNQHMWKIPEQKLNFCVYIPRVFLPNW